MRNVLDLGDNSIRMHTAFIAQRSDANSIGMCSTWEQPVWRERRLVEAVRNRHPDSLGAVFDARWVSSIVGRGHAEGRNSEVRPVREGGGGGVRWKEGRGELLNE